VPVNGSAHLVQMTRPSIGGIQGHQGAPGALDRKQPGQAAARNFDAVPNYVRPGMAGPVGPWHKGGKRHCLPARAGPHVHCESGLRKAMAGVWPGAASRPGALARVRLLNAVPETAALKIRASVFIRSLDFFLLCGCSHAAIQKASLNTLRSMVGFILCGQSRSQSGD
jgi:hypothetical protein